MRENSEIIGLYLMVYPKFNHFMWFGDIFL